MKYQLLWLEFKTDQTLILDFRLSFSVSLITFKVTDRLSLIKLVKLVVLIRRWLLPVTLEKKKLYKNYRLQVNFNGPLVMTNYTHGCYSLLTSHRQSLKLFRQPAKLDYQNFVQTVEAYQQLTQRWSHLLINNQLV